ncbi:cell filamentation protein Fic [Melaminivora suipulveris]|uniref:Cell filamentation protein Fic n=1 Tax=Melaminivora suipulveris TaxID=2109913 RepID=A0A2R3QDU7_9BURK|nr:virulence RhuM family protein [Melaminivora suipulveris]AVO49948.1 cell filamentation protein Fic [Melaminivora suipulveris]
MSKPRKPAAPPQGAATALKVLSGLGTEFLLYRTEDGQTRIDVRMSDETVWLSLNQLTELFGRDKSVISRHIRNVFSEGELERDSVVAVFATTAADGKTYQVEHFNLDVIISVGYRVHSPRGTQFRIWATSQLRDYLVKGFLLDDARFKAGGDGVYFDQLLARIRDIRSSEKVFWRKVLDIYATSIDYDPRNDLSRQFFATLQNKMHWAIHGKTAAELIASRADATKPYMGLTHWEGARPRKADVEIAKNYLGEEELAALNRVVTIYLEFAEGQALRRRPMTMANWIAKLDDFLRIADYEVLGHAGRISHQAALTRAHAEFDKFRALLDELPSQAERDFEAAVDKTPLIEMERALAKKKGGRDAA